MRQAEAPRWHAVARDPHHCMLIFSYSSLLFILRQLNCFIILHSSGTRATACHHSLQKVSAPWRAGNQTSGLIIRLSSFSASKINGLICHVATMLRPRYIRGHGKHR